MTLIFALEGKGRERRLITFSLKHEKGKEGTYVRTRASLIFHSM
jgi:hypothetical protein